MKTLKVKKLCNYLFPNKPIIVFYPFPPFGEGTGYPFPVPGQRGVQNEMGVNYKKTIGILKFFLEMGEERRRALWDVCCALQKGGGWKMGVRRVIRILKQFLPDNLVDCLTDFRKYNGGYASRNLKIVRKIKAILRFISENGEWVANKPVPMVRVRWWEWGEGGTVWKEEYYFLNLNLNN